MTRSTKWMGVALVTLLGTVAGAGMKISSPVVVSSGNATGAMGSARNSGDAVQYIGCTISGYAGTAPSVTCFAQDLTSYGACSTSDANIVAAASAIADDSYISFSWDGWGACTSLQVTKASHGAPKQP